MVCMEIKTYGHVFWYPQASLSHSDFGHLRLQDYINLHPVELFCAQQFPSVGLVYVHMRDSSFYLAEKKKKTSRAAVISLTCPNLYISSRKTMM